ncbi:MAG: thioredoxin family protein [Planctomycetota bacterium]|nr:thioredoxin family protein [Planctomycetota bacterium]
MKLPLLALSLAALTQLAVAGERWVEDYDAAVKIAREQNKNLLVDFTGSDWCGWCIRLHEEVFDHEAFDVGVMDNFVLVSLDFPRQPGNKAKVPNPARNAELAQLHGVGGYPTVLLMTPDGDVFGRTGYQPGGPAAYVAHLDQMIAANLPELKAIKAAVAKFEAAEGKERAKLLDGLLEQLSNLDSSSPFGHLLVGPVRAALTEGTKEQRLAAVKVLIKVGMVDADVVALAREFAPKNEDGLWRDALMGMLISVKDEAGVRAALPEMDAYTDAGHEPSADQAPTFYFMAAYWYSTFAPAKNEKTNSADAGLTSTERARRYAKLARPLWTNQQGAKERLEVLDGILGE